MIIAVVGTKGGVGKTTLAVQLAAAHAADGRRTLLVDGDRQRSATMSIVNRADRGDLPQISAVHYPDGRALRAQVLAQRDLYDSIVIDVGGVDSTSLRAALMVADAVIIPARPRAYEVWALEDIAVLLADARAQRDEFPAVVVLNLADPGVLAADNREAAAAVAAIGGLSYLDAPIVQRKAISNASAAGVSVQEQTPRDAKACAEMRRFVGAVDTLMIKA